MEPGQVFIVGMNGSGTTLLLDCLAGHSLLYGHREETKVLPYFLARQSRYGDLTSDSNFARLWRDLHCSLDARAEVARSTIAAIDEGGSVPRSAAAVFDSILKSLASKEGKRIWCEKTPMYVHHIRSLANVFPEARFIHVIRDGRDCAASFHRRWRFNPIRTVFRWKCAVRAGRQQGKQLGSRLYLEVRYEQLTSAPGPCLREICQFLGVAFEPAILQPARVRPRMTGSSATSITPSRHRSDRYFGADVTKKLERVAGKQLQELGYPIQYVAEDRDPPALTLRWWEAADDFRRLREAILRAMRMRRPGRIGFLSRRVSGAFRQKSSLK